MVSGSDVVIPFKVRVLTAECVGQCRLRYAYNGLGLVLPFEARKHSCCLVADLMAAFVIRARRLQLSMAVCEPLRLAEIHARHFLFIREMRDLENHWDTFESRALVHLCKCQQLDDRYW